LIFWASGQFSTAINVSVYKNKDKRRIGILHVFTGLAGADERASLAPIHHDLVK
jgi:hypothetical protein